MNKKSKELLVNGIHHIVLCNEDLQRVKRLKSLKSQLRALTETVKREQESLLGDLPWCDNDNVLVDGNRAQVGTYKPYHKNGYYVKPIDTMRLTLNRTKS